MKVSIETVKHSKIYRIQKKNHIEFAQTIAKSYVRQQHGNENTEWQNNTKHQNQN